MYAEIFQATRGILGPLRLSVLPRRIDFYRPFLSHAGKRFPIKTLEALRTVWLHTDAPGLPRDPSFRTQSPQVMRKKARKSEGRAHTSSARVPTIMRSIRRSGQKAFQQDRQLLALG
jgi:hypothetical protein